MLQRTDAGSLSGRLETDAMLLLVAAAIADGGPSEAQAFMLSEFSWAADDGSGTGGWWDGSSETVDNVEPGGIVTGHPGDFFLFA